MAYYYTDPDGKKHKVTFTTTKSKKKKKKDDDDIAPVKTTVKADDDDIAPVKRKEDDSKLDFFQKSMAFDDGWQVGDLTKTILGTAADAGLEVFRGVGSLVEGVTDAVSYGVAGITDVLGADEFAERTRKRAQENKVEQWTENLDSRFEQNSVLGRTSDAILQGVGQVGGILATGGIAGAAVGGAAAGSAAVAASTAATTGLMGISGFGSGASEAYRGGATDKEAMTYGMIAGVSDALTELLFGGLGKAVKATGLSVGLSSADDMLAKKVSNLFSSQITKNLAEYGIKAGAEGFEEVLAGTAQAIGKKITYMKEEELSEILKDENLLEQFVVGAATSGMLQSGYIPGMTEGSLREANKTGRDFITGLNQNEQTVVDKEVEKRIAAEEEGGKVLTKKEKNKIYDEVLSDMDRGGISIDTIEEVLGGDTYKTYKAVAEREDSWQREFDELGKKEKYTLADQTRYAELKKELDGLRQNSPRKHIQSQLHDEVFSLVRDSRLVESYNERTRRGQKFEVDLEQYKDEKQKAIVQKAAESGILNNTRKTHEFVDMVAKIAADKGVSFDFTNNAKLKESGFAIDGKQVNGFVTKDGVTVNVQSSKALNSVVGHEITHVLEGTELYNELQKAVFQYAESKKDLAGRRGSVTALYQGIEGADIDAELTADLVGDYLFTDSDFINNLSANHRNVFQKIYDEVKYLLKVAAAGSKEARELEKVKKAFEKAYRESEKNNTAEDGGTKYSLYLSPDDVPDYLKAGNRRNKNRQKRYDDGQQITVSTEAEFDSFVREAVGGKPGAMVAYGKVEEDLANQVKRMSDSKIDIDDAYLELLADDVQHAYTEHSSAKEEGDMDMSVDDLIYALKNVNQSEVVSAVQYDNGQQRVKLAIPAEDGMMMLVEIASKSAGTLRLKTGWKVTPEKFVEKYKSSTSATGSDSSTNTVREDAASNENVAQNGEDVKTQNSLSAENANQRTFGNYNVYGKDIALETVEESIAPVREDVAPVQEAAPVAGVQEDEYAPMTEDEAADMPMADLTSLTDEDAPAEVDTEAEEEVESAPPADPFENRDIKEVGKRSVKAFMSDNPEVKPFFQAEAEALLGELNSSVKGQRYYSKEAFAAAGIEAAWSGNSRHTSDDIAYLLDSLKMSYADIEKGLNAIIEDNGKENIAAAKRIEFVLDERLRKGYTDFTMGVKIPPNQDYINVLNQMQATDNGVAEFDALMENADSYAPPVEEVAAPVRADVTAPVAEDAVPVQEATVENTGGFVPDKQIATVKERLEAKLQSVQTELANNRQLREESGIAYDTEIARLQSDYNARANKNTKAANDILRRIERVKRFKTSVDADYAKRISDLEAKEAKAAEAVRTGESPEAQGAMRRELHAQKVDEIRSAYAEQGYDFDTVLENAKDLSTLATVDNTPQRVMEKALGYKEGQILADMTVNKVASNETDGIKWLNSYTDRKGGVLAQISKQYNIKPRSKESAAAQMYAEGFYVAENGDIIEYGDRELAKDFPDANVQANIKGLARDPRIRQIYDETLELINASRTRNAYPEIKKLDNYFLHFRAMDDTFSKLGIPFNPNDIKAKDLPTDLNGVTADLKPGQPYFASAMHRRGQRTSFDLLGGLEQYLTSAKDQIYHIDDIQTLRALRNHIADTYGQAKGLEGLDALTEEEAQAKLEQVYDAHLSTFAKFLNEEANVIAGKTALIDRGLEGIIGRRGMTFFDTLNRQVGANMVGFNVSSSLTNFIAPVQAFAKMNKAAFVKGFAQTVANRVGSIAGKTDGFIENNPTMIRRQGADRFSRTPWQKTADIGYALMGAVDSISTEIIVRSKYNELVSKGMSHEQAVTEADKWTSRLMGDRSLGQQPQLYNSKMLGLVTKFQLEVRNQLDSQFYDTIQEAKVSNEDIQNAQARNAKTAAQVASTFVQLAVVQHLFGKAFEAVAGYNPAFDIIEAIIKAFGWDDEEDSEDTVLDNLGQGFMNLLEDMPYSSIATGGRIPIASALPVAQLIKGEDKYGNEKSRLETLAETAPYYLLPGGYGQIKKTTQGLGMFDEDLPIAGSYTDSGNLRFPVEDTLANRAQAALFGQYASSNARDYFDNERQSLKKNQIQELVDVDIPIKDYWEYRDGLKEQETLEEKFDYIAGLDLPVEKKNILINNVVDRKEAVDLTDYDEYADYEEFDFAIKNPEKYDFLQTVGVSVKEYQSFDEDTKEAYNWAYNNPEKYTVSKAIASDVAVYRQYTKALNELTADKTADGKTISGSRKTKVVNYINSLDADYGEKIILFKSEYNSDDTYNREIIEYLNGRSDISYEEEVTILKELGFVVLPDGTVQW